MNTFKNLKEEKEYYREIYGVKALRGETLIKIAREQNVSEAFMKENIDKSIEDNSTWRKETIFLSEFFAQYQPLTLEFIQKNEDHFAYRRYSNLSKNKKIGFDVIEAYFYDLTLKHIIANPNFPEELITEHYDKITQFNYLVSERQLSEDFIGKHLEILQRECMFYRDQHLSFDFFNEHKERINWKDASEYIRFTEEQMKKLMEYINWSKIIERNKNSDDKYIKIPLEIVDRFATFIDLKSINKNQSLPEWFLRKHHTLIEHGLFNSKILFSEQFFYDFEYRINYMTITNQPNFPRELILKNMRRINEHLVGLYPLPEHTFDELNYKDDCVKRKFIETQDFSTQFYNDNTSLVNQCNLQNNTRLNSKTKKMIELKTMFKKN
jgi:hypothetical protein